MKKFLALVFLLLSFPVLAQTQFHLFDRIVAKGVGITPAKGQLFYTSDANGTIVPLIIGPIGSCLTVSGTLLPAWSLLGCGGGSSTITFSAPTQFTVTGSGTASISLAWQNVSQNYGLFGPTSGSGAPTFRQITASDLPVFIASGGSHAAGIVPDPGSTPGTGRFLREDATWSATGSGTVTSVGLSMPSQFGVTNSPVTSTGSLTVAWNTQTAHYAFVGPNTGSPDVPTFRLLTPDDLPVMTGTVAGIVPTPPNDVNQMLRGNGTWGTVTGSGTVTSVNMTVPSGFSVNGVPVIGSDTIVVTLDSQTARKTLISGSGGGVPAFRVLEAEDYPVMTATVRGSVPTPPNDAAKFLSGVGTWVDIAGGTVTSVDLSVPAGFNVGGSHPVTNSGTLALGFGTTTAYKVLSTNVSGTVGWNTLGPDHVSILQPSGAGHAAGLAPDTPALAGTTKFLREDSAWELPPQGTVTGVTASVPGEMSFSGGFSSGSGTLSFGWNTEAANSFFAGPVSGAADVPAFRVLVPADYPVFVGSGATHARGAVPDPGVTPGTSKFLREDSSWQTPTFSSSIEVKEVDGSPDVTGVSILRFDQAAFSVSDNGGGTATVACTACGGGGVTATKIDAWDGDGGTVDFTASSTPIVDGTLAVTLNGLAQPPAAYSISGSILTMVATPITGDSVGWTYYTTLAAGTQLVESFSGAGTTDFTLAHAPLADGINLVARNGVIQIPAVYSIIAGTTLRFASAIPTGETAIISYRY